MKENLQIDQALLGQVWRYENRGLVRRRIHHHEELEVNLVLAGNARYLVGEQRYDLFPGVQIWLFPQQEHLLIDESADYKMWVAVFRRSLLAFFCSRQPEHLLLQEDPGQVYCRMLHQATVRHLDHLFAQGASASHQPILHNAMLAHLVMAAWQAQLDAKPIELGRNIHPAVEQAAKVLRDHPGQDDLPALAARCALSPARLSRLFAAQTGLTITEYRNRQRVQRFLELDAASTGTHGDSLMDVALKAGFGSYPQFHRVFVQVMNQTPAAYRRSFHLR